jgi:hypothetical protein
VCFRGRIESEAFASRSERKERGETRRRNKKEGKKTLHPWPPPQEDTEGKESPTHSGMGWDWMVKRVKFMFHYKFPPPLFFFFFGFIFSVKHIT